MTVLLIKDSWINTNRVGWSSLWGFEPLGEHKQFCNNWWLKLFFNGECWCSHYPVILGTDSWSTHKPVEELHIWCLQFVKEKQYDPPTGTSTAVLEAQRSKILQVGNLLDKRIALLKWPEASLRAIWLPCRYSCNFWKTAWRIPIPEDHWVLLEYLSQNSHQTKSDQKL